MTPVASRRAAAVAALCLLLGLVTGPPSHAAEPDVIEGTVEIPPGTGDADFSVRLFAQEGDGPTFTLARTEPVVEGSFTVAALPEGVPFRVELLSTHPDYVSGFWAGPGQPLVGVAVDGLPVQPGSAPLALTPTRATELRGTVQLPEDFDWSAGPVRAGLMELSRSNRVARPLATEVEITENGEIVFPTVRPTGRYVLGFYDFGAFVSEGPVRFQEGSWNAASGGLVPQYWHGTPLIPGTRFHATIPYSHVEPVLASLASPSISGTAQVGSTLSADPGAWSIPWIGFTYQWLRNGKEITGATGPTYLLKPADAESRVSVRVMAGHVSFPSATASSPSVPVSLAPAPRTTKVKVTGTARLGSRLKAGTVSWDVTGTRTTYQWLRNGKKIKGASSRSYRLTTKDVGKKISVRVTGTAPGHRPGSSTSAAKKVAKGKPKVTTKANRAASKLTVRVKVAGLPEPRGKLTVKIGKKTVKATLKAKHRGKVTVRLPRLKPGRYKVSTTFKPTGSHKKLVKSAKAKKITVRVR